MTQVKINKTDFIADVNAGLTRKQLQEKYTVPVSIINDWTKQLNLTIAIKKEPKYLLVDEEIAPIVTAESSNLPEWVSSEPTAETNI